MDASPHQYPVGKNKAVHRGGLIDGKYEPSFIKG